MVAQSNYQYTNLDNRIQVQALFCQVIDEWMKICGIGVTFAHSTFLFSKSTIFQTVADTWTNVPYGALGPEMTDDPEERNSVFFFVGIFMGFGVLFAAVTPIGLTYLLRNNRMTALIGDLTEPCINCYTGCTAMAPELSANFTNELCATSYGTNITSLDNWCDCNQACYGQCDVAASRSAMTTVALVFGVYYIISMMSLVGAVTERSHEGVSAKQPPLVPSLMGTLRNKPFMTLIPSW